MKHKGPFASEIVLKGKKREESQSWVSALCDVTEGNLCFGPTLRRRSFNAPSEDPEHNQTHTHTHIQMNIQQNSVNINIIYEKRI